MLNVFFGMQNTSFYFVASIAPEATFFILSLTPRRAENVPILGAWEVTKNAGSEFTEGLKYDWFGAKEGERNVGMGAHNESVA